MGKWTREHILREILRRDAAGLPLVPVGPDGVGPAFRQAADRIFGSWPNAVAAAGLAPDRARARHPWPPSRILTVIRSLARRRTPLTAAELRHRHGYLVAAARRSFGSWAVAVVAAGVDPQRLRPPRLWTRERLVEAILTRALRGEPLGRRGVQPRSLAEAAAREFGSWAAALRAAGLEPDQYLNGPPGSPAARPGRSQLRLGRARAGSVEP